LVKFLVDRLLPINYLVSEFVTLAHISVWRICHSIPGSFDLNYLSTDHLNSYDFELCMLWIMKLLFFASENSPLFQIEFLTPRWGILFGPLQAFDVYTPWGCSKQRCNSSSTGWTIGATFSSSVSCVNQLFQGQ